VTQLVNSVDEFMIAHEYGHLVNGHIGNAMSDLKLASGSTISVVSKNQQQEFQADRWAINALVSSPSSDESDESHIICSGP
jgi:predicted metalloprotease